MTDKRDPNNKGASRMITPRDQTYTKVCDQCRANVNLRRDYDFDHPNVRRFEGTCTCGHVMRVEKA